MSDTTITQSNSGTGDNILGSKIIIESPITVISATAPENLKEPISKIINEITNRNFDEARHILDTVETVDNLENDAKDLIKLLRVKCDLSERGSLDINVRDISKIKESTDNSTIKDLAESFLIIVEFERNGSESAKKRYEASEIKGPNSNSVAYKLLATEDELNYLHENKIFVLSEEELSGLINGFLRLNKLEEAQAVAKYLDDNYESYNSGFIKHYISSLRYNEDLDGRDYWIITQAQKNEIGDLINKTITMFKKGNRNDDRLFNILFPALIYTHGENEELFAICKSNIDKLLNFSSDISDQARVILGDDKLSENHPVSVLKKAESDPVFRHKVKGEILSRTEVCGQDLWLGKNMLTEEELKVWLSTPRAAKDEHSELGRMFVQLTIYLMMNDDENVESYCKGILKVDSSEFYILSSAYLKNCAENLVYHDKSKLACDLMYKFLADLKGIWASPVIEFALQLLQINTRYKNLNEIALNVNDQDKSTHVFNLVIWSNLYHGSAEQAYEVIQKSSHDNDIKNISLRLKVLKRLEKNKDIRSLLESVNLEIFNSPHPDSLEFVEQILILGHFDLYERIVINWFLESPEKNYLAISEAYFIMISHANRLGAAPTLSYNICGLNKGVRYSEGDKNLVKIISDKENNNNIYIISSSSHLGGLFNESKQGDVIEHGVKTLNINDVVPPIVAINDIVTKIRDESNDGSDAFQILKFSSNGEDFIKTMSKAIPAKDIDENVYQTDIIPLSVRMRFIDKQDPIQSSFSLLLNPKTNIQPLIHDGHLINKEASTDFITIVYICLTSYCDYFIQNGISLYILAEEIEYINNWIRTLEENKSITVNMDESGRLYFLTSEMFKTEMSVFYRNIISVCSILRPLPVLLDNYDSELSKNTMAFSPGYIKSLYAIKNSNHPYLTIDTQNGVMFHSLFKVLPANSAKIFAIASQYVPFQRKISGIKLLVKTRTPYFFTSTDYLNLAIYPMDYEGDYLHALLKRNYNAYRDNLNLPKFLASIFFFHLDKLVMSYRGSRPFESFTYQHLPGGPRLDRIFNICCDSMINYKKNAFGFTIEEKISRFISELGYVFQGDEGVIGLVDYLAMNFVTGRFLDPTKVVKLSSSILRSRTGPD